jgi:hypothetical protein
MPGSAAAAPQASSTTHTPLHIHAMPQHKQYMSSAHLQAQAVHTPARVPAPHHAVLQHRGQVAALGDAGQVRRQLLQVVAHPVLHPAVQHAAVAQVRGAGGSRGGAGAAVAGQP